MEDTDLTNEDMIKFCKETIKRLKDNKITMLGVTVGFEDSTSCKLYFNDDNKATRAETAMFALLLENQAEYAKEVARKTCDCEDFNEAHCK